MSIIKLDRKRSIDDRFSFKYEDLTYYQINDSNELCVRIDGTKAIGDIQKDISIAPKERGTYHFRDGDYRVTTMLINIDNNKMHDTYIGVPSCIERVYFSDHCVSRVPDYCVPDLYFKDNHPFFKCDDFPLWEIGVFSKNKTELFKYRIRNNKNRLEVKLPDDLQTIHNYAFMYAGIGTLRIPASVTEIGKKAFLNAKINNIVFEGKWTAGIDPEAFTGMKYIGGIWINDTAQNISSYNNLLEAVDNDCRKLTLAAPSICKEASPAIGYIRATQAYYSDGYRTRWNDIRHNEGIIDINTRHIVSVKEYEIPTYIPVTGSKIMLHGSNNDHQHYCYIVYEPVEMVLQKIDTAVKQLNATGCTVDELIDRIQNKIK